MSHPLETIIGYQFKNPKLLETALTHTSYANESRTPVQHNERLEFLGDSVLQIVSADYLFHAYADRPEGDLTRIRSSLVSEGALFQFAQEINLGEYLRLGRGEERCGGRTRPSVVSDAFEAVIAALYLDGGMEVAKSFILPFITEGKHAEADYKTRLQEIVQQNPEEKLSYVVEQETGPDHNKQFTVCVWRNGELLAEGRETGPMMLGCVVDMPSAAVMAGDMMEHGAQLMAVDIEDLTRYTLGLVQNPTAAVNQLTNPAVLRLVSGILEQAQEHGAQVYLCGITVAAVDAMPAYLKLGIRTFSAEPAALLPLKKLLMEQELTQ